jgi:hypothetical protein
LIWDFGFGISDLKSRSQNYKLPERAFSQSKARRSILNLNLMTANEQRQGTVKVLRHESEILKNNPLGDPHIRDLYVYLPPEYEDETERRFPVAARCF